MQRFFFTAAILLVSLSAAAQLIRFSDSTNKWTTYKYNCHNYSPGFAPVTGTLSYDGDTMIVGLTYRRLGAGNFIREDTIANKVYLREYNDTIEHLLYDYSLGVGDSFKVFTQGAYLLNVANFVVSAVDSVLINSLWYKTWSFHVVSATLPDYADFYVIAGIGCLSGQFAPVFPGSIEECDPVTCFQNKGATPVVSPAADGYFDNDASCSLAFLGVNIPNVAKSEWTIYPSPASASVTISAQDPIHQISISDISGQTISTTNCNALQVQIDVHSLPPGLYFIKVNGSGVRKWVKE